MSKHKPGSPISSSPVAVDVFMRSGSYVRKTLEPDAKTHCIQWYERRPGGEWERKTQNLTQEQAEQCRAGFEAIIKGEPRADILRRLLGIEDGQDAEIVQLTMTYR